MHDREITQIIGESIRTWRVSRGLSQQQVAVAIGVTFQQMQKYESGRNRISATRLMRLCYAFEEGIVQFLSPALVAMRVQERKGGGRVK